MESTFQHHSGFVLYDLEADKNIYQRNADKYFTPASNTKILTFYTAVNIIGDSIPAYYYLETNDSLVIWGSGDPSFLYGNLPQGKINNRLQEIDKPIYLSFSNFADNHFGPGWAWDDYLYSFSSEKSAFPIYGNYMTIRKQKNTPYLSLDVEYFKPNFQLGDSIRKSQVTRSYGNNEIEYEPALNTEAFKREVPFHADNETIAALLADTLKKPVSITNLSLPKDYKVAYSMATDSVYKVMMQDSDNFIAEQLLLVCSGIISDSLKVKKAIEWAQDSLLSESPDPFVWKDGSGLSRYNLMTPRSAVWLWHQLYKQLGQERLFALIAAGGSNGTLENYYRSEAPFIYGKTGTLSNNHSLSGFLKAKSGKIFIFSFMNNNYPGESRPVKKEMEQLLQKIYNNY
ncbi:D-alanyl-D-alanine carboxypeptidase/D-alanyl-D-alanine-endopeptidase [Fulvivirga aurantia]|uniref:D-alanyl-D-alanine carboxypeptidase/D-alanyl-D-alanine-endopeptidase n=1 Tax=Fulvivirga aurantia TaxID=2529383 RepID=UPI001CA3C639|nr:D-alanyl-D-alanine carboxypeptidase [Fulvivirga aurantia]